MPVGTPKSIYRRRFSLMATLDEATSRLAAAVTRLEGALSGAEAKPAAAAPATQPATRGQGDLFAADERDALRKQLKALTAERDGLRKELETAQAENTRLQGLTAELSTGLDAAIGELKTVLDE